MQIVARTLSGFRDHLPREMLAKNMLLGKVSEVFLKFGFSPIDTPHIEYADILVKHGSDEILREMYRFKDRGDRDVALRFDLTVPLARFIAQHQQKLEIPFKRYAIGNVFRGERAQRGRYREFTQCDFDFIGSDSLSCDAEILQVIYASLNALGIKEFVINLNHRAILDGICKYFNVLDKSTINKTLRIIDKIDKIDIDVVKKELQAIKELNNIDEFLSIIRIRQECPKDEFFASIAYLKEWNEDLKNGIEDLEELYTILQNLQMQKDSYRVNFSIARGLGYYTGIVYETFLCEMLSIGSVCSGGRYDNLTSTFLKQNLSGVGASIGIDRLIVAMGEMGLLNVKSTPARALLVCMDKEYFSYVHALAESFRRSKLAIEVYPDITKLRKAFSYANALGHEFVMVVGEREFQSNTIMIKNMTSGLQVNEVSFLEAVELLKENS